MSKSLCSLLWQAVKHKYELSSTELALIDQELAGRIRAKFPDGIVNTGEIYRKHGNLEYHLSLRTMIEGGSKSVGPAVRKLGFALVSDTSNPAVRAKRTACLKQRILDALKEKGIATDRAVRKRDITQLNNSTLAHRIRKYGRAATGKDSISAGLNALGYQTISIPHPVPAEGELRERINEKLVRYNLAGSRVIRKGDIRDKKDNSLARKLRNLGKMVSGKDSISAGLRALGYETNSRRKQQASSLRERLLAIWSHDKVQEAYGSNDPSRIISLKEFGEKYPALARELREQGGNAEKCINSIHESFPHLYSFISRFVKSVDEKQLGERLRTAFFRDRVNIAPTALKDSDNPGHRKMYRQVLRAGIGPLGIKMETPCETIARLAGLKKKDFSCMVYRDSALLAEATERAAKLVLLVTALVDPSGAYFKNGFSKYFPPIIDVNPVTGSRVRLYRRDGSYIEPDALVSSARRNYAVETKSGTTVNAARDLFDKYPDLSDFEGDGAAGLDGVIAIIQMNRRVYEQLLDPLGERSIKAVPPEKFLEYLSKAIAELECSPCHTYVAEAVPRVHSLANIYRFHEMVVNAPHLALKPANRKLMEHHNQALGGIVRALEDAVQNTKILNNSS